MSKLTPKPWTTVCGYFEGSLWIKVQSMAVPERHDLTKDDAEHAVACVNNCAGINPEAVPDMLEALKGIMFNNPDLTTGLEWADKRERAFNAIAKAEGRTP